MDVSLKISIHSKSSLLAVKDCKIKKFCLVMDIEQEMFLLCLICCDKGPCFCGLVSCVSRSVATKDLCNLHPTVQIWVKKKWRFLNYRESWGNQHMVQNYMFTKEHDQKTTYTVCRYVETKQQIFYNLLDRYVPNL